MLRLQKYLADAGICSRRAGEAYIAAGRVVVNGEVVTRQGVKIDPDSDLVAVDGKSVDAGGKKVYIMLNKPAGVITSCKQKGRKIVTDLVDVPQRVFPVGRLDRDSTGLLILTNDGRLHHRLSHPSFDHEKEYHVELENPVSGADLSRMAKGIIIDGRKTREASVKRLGPRRFSIVLKEGRNRQIRKMAEALGNRVAILHRVRIACVRIGNLGPGKWRHIDPKTRQALLALLVSYL
ncbi:MAG: rRNA pseudouridine synthase [Deltaproteobacteria bacterium]|nr:rRNA pseudouridine synthase [Deltaproteobacteria bacterium]